jgi:uncharacterized protein YecE (DUF72 family)
MGLSGLELPVPKYQFPPEHQASSRLTYYATLFNTIEVNSSFYKIPGTGTVARWASSVVNDFVFTFKLFKEVTHCKELNFSPSVVEEFIQTINSIREKKGCLLIQFPPSLRNEHIGQLDKLLSTVRAADPSNLWKVAAEFRFNGWYNPDVFDLLETSGAALVLHDIPKSATPMNQVASQIVYVRFHGPTGNYRGSYTDAFLHEYAEYITEWLSDGKEVFVYFNNTAGDAFNNCQTLRSLLSG